MTAEIRAALKTAKSELKDANVVLKAAQKDVNAKTKAVIKVQKQLDKARGV